MSGPHAGASHWPRGKNLGPERPETAGRPRPLRRLIGHSWADYTGTGHWLTAQPRQLIKRGAQRFAVGRTLTHHQRRDRAGKPLSQFHAPLVEGVDAPHHA